METAAIEHMSEADVLADLRASLSRVRVWREALGDSCALDFSQP